MPGQRNGTGIVGFQWSSKEMPKATQTINEGDIHHHFTMFWKEGGVG